MTKVWVVRTSHGFIDIQRYKTLPALNSQRNYYWRTEKGARQAFAEIEHRFPKMGPEYELWEADLVNINGMTWARPVGMVEKKTAQPKDRTLYIIPHDRTLDGDSAFTADSSTKLRWNGGMTVKELRDCCMVREVGYAIQDFMQIGELHEFYEMDLVKGGWVVNDDQLQFINEIWESDERGSDSALYRTNHLAKLYLERHCVKRIGRRILPRR